MKIRFEAGNSDGTTVERKYQKEKGRLFGKIGKQERNIN